MSGLGMGVRGTARALPQGALPRGMTLVKRGVVLLGLAVLALLPAWGSDYLIGLVVLTCIYGTVTVSWNLVLGFGGLFTFGQLAFFAVGGYASALLSIHIGLSPWLGLLVGAVAGGMAGALVGLPSLRLYGPYMVLFTLAFQEILRVLLVTDTSGVTGGAFGLQSLPVLTVGDVPAPDVALYVGLAMLVATVMFIGWLLRTPFGVAVQSLRDSEAATVARGVNRTFHRVAIFVISAMFTGLAGAFYAHYYGVITPSILSIGLLVQLLAMIIIGGSRSSLGVVAGTAALVWLSDRLATEQQYSALLWGAIIVVVVLVMPGGIAGTAAWIRDRASSMLDSWFEDQPEREREQTRP